MKGLSDIRKQHLLIVLLLLYLSANLMVYTPRFPFTGEEGRRAIVAQEMLLTGNYITPTVFQSPYYKKPPMHNWLIALVSSGTGTVTRVSARIVSVLSLLIIGLSMYIFMLRRYPKIALTAFLAATTNFLMLCEYGNAAESDVVLTMFTFLSYVFYASNPVRFVNVSVSALFMGMGILTKGLSPLYFYPGILIFIVADRTKRAERIRLLLVHFSLSMVLPVVWLVLYSFHGDVQSLLSMFSSEVASRTDRSLWGSPWHLFSFPLKVFRVLLPWSLVVWLAYRPNHDRNEIYTTCLLNFLISFSIFALLPGSKDRYLMPAFPLFAIVVAHHIEGSKILGRTFQWVAFGLFSASSFVLAVLAFGKGYRLQAAIFLFAGAALLLLMRRRYDVMKMTTMLVSAFLVFYMHGFYFHRSEYRFDHKQRAAAISRMIDADVPIVVDPSVNIRTGLYVEGILKRPLYRKDVSDFREYYYLSFAPHADSTGEELIRLPHPERPERTLVLQRVRKQY